MHEFIKKIETSRQDKLSTPFFQVKEPSQIMMAVNKAETQFKSDIVLAGFTQFDPHTSSVHGFNDSKAQAFIVAIPSNNEEEMGNKAYLAYAAHFIDDFFDRPDLPPTPQQMKEKRNNIHSLVHSVQGLGEFVDMATSKAKNPTGFNKGLKRLMYGGLIQLAESESEQVTYLSEYKKISLEHVDEVVASDILKLRDIPYWMTTKTIQEFFFSAEPTENLTLAELWSIAYAPAIYLHDYKEEQEKGELNFFNQKLPSLDEMKDMLDLTKKHLPNYKDDLKESRLTQLEFLTESFSPVLPKEILGAYKDLANNLKNK